MDLTFLTIVCGATAVIAIASSRARQMAALRTSQDNPQTAEQDSNPDAQWLKLASDHSLTLITGAESTNHHPDDRKVIGQLKGFPVELAVEHDATRALRCWGRIRFRPSLRLGLDIDQVKRLFERTSLQTGDARFDRAFVVRSSDPGATARLLTSPVRQALIELATHVDRIALTDNGLWWMRRRPDPWARGVQVAQSEADLKRMEQLALALRGACQQLELHHAAQIDDSVHP
ncbi:MAG: hypothetical protein AAFS10_22040 [Myxococcota bacterium]